MKLNSKLKTILIIVVVAALVIGLSAAAVILSSNHITHPDPLPTPTPAPTETPDEETPITPTAVTLTTNYTDINTMMSGDFIRFTAQLDKPVSGITINYYNNGTQYDTYLTDASGKAVFTRGPYFSAFDVHVEAIIP